MATKARKPKKKQPPPPPPPPQEPRGSTRMRALGRRLVSLWFAPHEYDVIKAHCTKRHQAVATFVRNASLDTAGYTLFRRGAES